MPLVGPRSRRFVPLAFVLAATSLAACRDKPQEVSTPVASAASKPVVPPLTYELPGTWPKVAESQISAKRATFKVPRAGADTEDAELTVYFFGTGSQGDADKNFSEWFSQFDGNAAATAARTTLDSPAGKVDTVEVAGTYKVALGPTVGPKKRAAMQMVKDNWRLYGAVVRTKDRGNWFFKLTGPNETVQSAKGSLEASLQAAR
ncbi:MAG: hypothetical protein R3B70_14670 [Polyangiaceae bacterium]